MQEEEAGGGGVATVLVDGTKLTKGGAAFVNSELIYAGGKWDTFRMLTHPGCNILPTGLLAAELESATGQQYITGIVAGLRSHGAHGRRLHPDGHGARLPRRARVRHLRRRHRGGQDHAASTREQIHGAIAQCVNLAAGNLEGARSGGRSLREGGAVRNALLAVALAKQGMPRRRDRPRGRRRLLPPPTPATTAASSATPSTGPSRQTSSASPRTSASAGSSSRRSTASTPSPASTSPTSTSPPALCRDNDIRPEDIDRIEAVVNWFETALPQPGLPGADRDNQPKPGSTHYYSAYGAVERGFPLLKTGPEPDDPPAVLDLMQRVTLIPSKRQTLFGPKITIFTKDGKRYTRKATGREFIWDFDEEVRRIGAIAGGIPISESQYAELIEACRNLEALPDAAELIRLTIPGN